MITRKNISRIFYIYTEATLAVFMTALALVELGCYFAVPEFFQPVALGAAVTFVFVAIYLVTFIYNCEKKWSE